MDIKDNIEKITSELGEVEQFGEKYPYSIFPQGLAAERPDRVIAALMEGQTAIMLNGTPFALISPTVFTQFFQSVENYYQRTLVAGAERIIRILSVLALPPPFGNTLNAINY
jgi:hypothetical protein